MEEAPPIQSLTGPQALEYVLQMLMRLIETHEKLVNGPHGRKMSRDRRPSSGEAEREAVLVALTLREGTPAYESDNDQAVIEDEDFRNNLLNRFWLKTVPKISVQDYLKRYDKYCRSSPASYLATGYFIYQMSVVHRKMAVTRNNVYRIFAAAFSNAAKVVEDVLYPYKRYATTGGLSTQDLSKLEISFAFMCDFEFKIDHGLLQDSLHQWVNM